MLSSTKKKQRKEVRNLNKKTVQTLICLLSFSGSFLLGPTFTHLPTTEAFSLKKVGNVVGTVQEQQKVKKSLEYYEEDGRHELFEALKQEDKVNTDTTLNQSLQAIMTRLTAGIVKSEPSIKEKPYNYFINPSDVFNAYCTLGHNISINTGVFHFFENQEDLVAVVVAHEIAHGQRKHPLEGAKKKMTVELATKLVSIGLNNNGMLAADVVANQVKTVGVTRKNETEADLYAFQYIADSGYNVGAPAAVWQRVIKESSSNSKKNLFTDILNPSTHPENTQRRDAYLAQLTKYSQNKITVDASTGEVKLNQRTFLTPAASGNMSAIERSFFVAGNLARIFHDPSNIVDAKNENGTVKVGNYPIITPIQGDLSADEVVRIFNSLK